MAVRTLAAHSRLPIVCVYVCNVVQMSTKTSSTQCSSIETLPCSSLLPCSPPAVAWHTLRGTVPPAAPYQCQLPTNPYSPARELSCHSTSPPSLPNSPSGAAKTQLSTPHHHHLQSTPSSSSPPKQDDLAHSRASHLQNSAPQDQSPSRRNAVCRHRTSGPHRPPASPRFLFIHTPIPSSQRKHRFLFSWTSPETATLQWLPSALPGFRRHLKQPKCNSCC